MVMKKLYINKNIEILDKELFRCQR